MTHPADVPDDGETIFSCEPLLPSEDGPHWAGLCALADEIRSLSDQLPVLPAARDREADWLERDLRASFLIEGEVAERSDVAAVQRAAPGCAAAWMSEQMLCALHKELASADPRWEAGALRTVRVAVGRHVAPSPGAVPRLLAHMSRTYGRAGRLSRLLGVAASHHRLAWVHPFGDWNGRVGRLAASLRLQEELPGAMQWSLSEGLLRRRDEYLALMAAADEPRRGDRDGRGNLSEMRLAEFMTFFFEVMLEQIDAAGSRPEQ